MSKIAQRPESRRFQLTAALAVEVQGGRVDYSGGKWNAGLIRGVSVLTRGEALGHYFWVDAFMLDQCLSFMQARQDRGLKCRFTHPGLCSDGLAKGLGVFLNPSRSGDQVIADLHFNNFAHTSPDGDLAKYVMDRANEDPEHFGTSIVFSSDWDAEDEFMDENEQQVKEDGQTRHKFISPDADNVQNLPHARIAELWACDCVDDPAANPSGFFHRDLSTIKSAEGFLDFALGLSDERPETVSFGVDPDRARQFLSQWATRRGLSLPAKGAAMPKIFKKGKLSSDTTAEPKPGDTKTEDGTPPEEAVTCPDCGAVFVPDKAEPTTQEPMPSEYAANHKKFVEAFGADNGSKWFFEKISFDAAQVRHYQVQLAAKDEEIKTLKAQLAEANVALAAIANSGERPLDSSPPPKGGDGDKSDSVAFQSLFKIKG